MRLDSERQERLEPKRIERAVKVFRDLGLDPRVDGKKVVIDSIGVTYWPYSGWASGKSIKDGRGLNNLLRQLKK